MLTKKKIIVFLSHQWKSREEPDPTGEDWKAATLAIESLAATYKRSLDDFVVWIDYTSIPQRNRPCQSLSISSLPFYASFARFFLVICPQVSVEGREYSLESYQKRGWCRLEQFARISMCGVAHMYACYGTAERPAVSMSSRLDGLTTAVHVMDGEFTVDDEMRQVGAKSHLGNSIDQAQGGVEIIGDTVAVCLELDRHADLIRHIDPSSDHRNHAVDTQRHHLADDIDKGGAEIFRHDQRLTK